MSRLAFIFDVETSGLIRKGEEFPHILQLSYILYDIKNKQVMTSYDTFVKPSEPVIVEEIITKLTGITQKDTDGGIPIRQVLEDFFQILQLADIIVGHNIEFDKKMIALEIARMYPNTFSTMVKEVGEKSLLGIWDMNVSIKDFCTMRNSTTLCNIIRSNRRGSYVKFPKLSETYEKLFGQVPENLHNSLTDTIVCLRCFMRLAYKEDIGEITTE